MKKCKKYKALKHQLAVQRHVLRRSSKHRKNKRGQRVINRTKEIKTKHTVVNIVAPSVFSMIDNTEEVLLFLSTLERCLKKERMVFVDLSKVTLIAHGAIVVLLSIMTKFKAKRINFNGNFPENRTAKKILDDSGFINELYKTNVRLTNEYAVSKNQIFTHANKVVDQKLTDSIITEATKFLWGDMRRCMGVQRVYIELMQNTNNHASFTTHGEHHWWTTVQYDKKEQKVLFSFLDYGVGIINSLKNDSSGKFFNIIPKIMSIFQPHSNAEMLQLLLKGEIHRTSTNSYFRGKGLPCLFKACDDKKISNVVVIANDAKVEYKSDSAVVLNRPFNGTFVYWELCVNNENISY